MKKNKIYIVIGIAGLMLILSYMIGSNVDVSSFIHDNNLAWIFLVFIGLDIVLVLLMLVNKEKRSPYLKALLGLVLITVCCNIMTSSYPDQTSSRHYTSTTATHKTTTSNTNSSTYPNYSSKSYSHSDFDVEDYDDPDDFYDDHETDFEDYEEAEEYWYDYN